MNLDNARTSEYLKGILIVKVQAKFQIDLEWRRKTLSFRFTYGTIPSLKIFRAKGNTGDINYI